MDEQKEVAPLYAEFENMSDDQLAKILSDYKKRQNIEQGESGELGKLLEKYRPVYGADVYRVAEALLLKTVSERWLQQYKNRK